MLNVDEKLLTLEVIERLKQQDERFRDFDLRLQVEKELRESVAVKLILDAAGEQAAQALEELAEVDPTNTNLIVRLQAKVFRARFIARSINTVIRRGEMAEESLKDEPNIPLDDGET